MGVEPIGPWVTARQQSWLQQLASLSASCADSDCRGQGIVAVMDCFADAAGVRRGGCRQGQRGEVPHEREEQQKSGDEAMHALPRVEPLGEARIEQNAERAQAGGRGRPPHTAPHTTLGFAVDLGPPPADADEEETPVAEEFRRLAFEGVSDELEDPSQEKQASA